MEYLIKKICDPLFEKINSVISICSINKFKDSTRTQTAQAEFTVDEVREDLERWQNYGITSVPPPKSEGICLFVGGERRRGFIIATEDKDTRPLNLSDGEVCLYTIEKDKIHFKKGNMIDIKTKKLNIISDDKIDFQTKNLNIKLSKICIKNDSNELIDLISKLIDTLSNTTTNTMIGQMPLNCKPDLIELKGKIDTFKT